MGFNLTSQESMTKIACIGQKTNQTKSEQKRNPRVSHSKVLKKNEGFRKARLQNEVMIL